MKLWPLPTPMRSTLATPSTRFPSATACPWPTTTARRRPPEAGPWPRSTSTPLPRAPTACRWPTRTATATACCAAPSWSRPAWTGPTRCASCSAAWAKTSRARCWCGCSSTAEGAPAESGTVYFLPPDIDLAVDRAQLKFTTGEGAGHYATLPANDSAVVFLSGAQVARVDDAMALAAAGALVFAQSSESCYDSAAVDALVARGAEAAEPADLAQALLDRWP